MTLCTEMEKLLHMYMSLEAEVDETEYFLYDTYMYAYEADDAGTYTFVQSHLMPQPGCYNVITTM